MVERGFLVVCMRRRRAGEGIKSAGEERVSRGHAI